MDDEGAGDSLRRCIASGDSVSPDKMIRFVIGPDDFVVPDLSHKLPGRGCWVTSSREAVRKAIERDLFSKAAKRKVKCAPDLDALIEGLLVRRCCDLLGFARRAGIVTSGFAKVEMLVRAKAGRIAALVEACDSGPADRGKLFGYARKNRDIRVIGNLTQAEIGLAFGRENVVHAALTQSPLAVRFISEAERLGGFRVLCPLDWDVA
jgi:predicted RNA-binding protein YlxR (DUF448 family)